MSEASSDIMDYDFAAWRARLGLTRESAAATLGISESHYAKMERDGKGRKLYAWAVYGVECRQQAQLSKNV